MGVVVFEGPEPNAPLYPRLRACRVHTKPSNITLFSVLKNWYQCFETLQFINVQVFACYLFDLLWNTFSLPFFLSIIWFLNCLAYGNPMFNSSLECWCTSQHHSMDIHTECHVVVASEATLLSYWLTFLALPLSIWKPNGHSGLRLIILWGENCEHFSSVSRYEWCLQCKKKKASIKYWALQLILKLVLPAQPW